MPAGKAPAMPARRRLSVTIAFPSAQRAQLSDRNYTRRGAAGKIRRLTISRGRIVRFQFTPTPAEELTPTLLVRVTFGSTSTSTFGARRLCSAPSSTPTKTFSEECIHGLSVVPEAPDALELARRDVEPVGAP